jgi:hypothetical protein
MVPETADRLVQAEGLRWAVIVGDYDNSMYVSVRVNDRRFSAGKLVTQVIKEYPEGSAGGHGSMAGMRVAHSARVSSRGARTRARRKLLKRLLEEIGVADIKPEPFAPEKLADEVSPQNGDAKRKSDSSPPRRVSNG